MMEPNELLEVNLASGDIFKEMAEAGIFYGHKKTKTHPKMKSCIFSTRNNIELIDLKETLAALDKAKEFIKEKISQGATMLLVATQPAARETIENLAEKTNFPYVTKRWLGGTLTNFKVINQRVNHYLDIKAKKEKGELNKYTKKERGRIDRDLDKMEKIFKGLINLGKLPDLLLIIDTEEHRTAVREAKRLGIPVVAIMSTDCDPSLVAYPIVANDHSRNSVEWLLNYLDITAMAAKTQINNIEK